MRLTELAERLGADLVHPEATASTDVDVTAVRPIQHAGPGEVTFLTSAEYAKYLAASRAAAVIVQRPLAGAAIPQLVHPNPYWAFARTTQLFAPPADHTPGVHDGAFVSETATLGADVTIHAGAVVDRGAELGARVVLYPGAYVGRDVRIGDDSIVHANAVVQEGVTIGARVLLNPGCVIGGEGFGFAPGPDGLAKIVQAGGVRIGDDVEVGANTTIDRGAMDDTVIGDGTKIDSQVQIGHNVVIGRHSLVCGMSGLAGSSKIGNGVMIGGHSAVTNHCEVADGVQLAGMSGITKSVSQPGRYAGLPAAEVGEWRRERVRIRRLPELEARVRELEARLDALGRD